MVDPRFAGPPVGSAGNAGLVRQRAGVVLSLSVALALSGAVAAQSGRIQGQVSDRELDGPLAGVRVTISDLRDRSTETSELGNYAFRDLPPGRYTLVYSRQGYVDRAKTVQVKAGQVVTADVSLAGDFTEMEEFVAQDLLALSGGNEAGLLQLRFDSPALLDSVSADLMRKGGASDAADALRLVAGASVQNGKSAVIRGLPDRYVSSQMNGVRLPTADEDKRAVELDQFPAAVIESVQVSKTFTPDQQGDASGGAVNVRLRGVPDRPFFMRFTGQAGRNSQVAGRDRFLTYEGGGLSYWGKDNGGRSVQTDNIGDNWDGAVGVSRGQAPVDYKWSGSVGGSYELGGGVKVGGFASVFYERDSSFFDQGVDDSRWVESPGAGMTPKSFQGQPTEGDFKTQLFDVVRGSQSVQWGGLGTVGLESENHKLNLAYLFTRTTEDEAVLAEDTRGKHHYFPGHNPDDPTSPGSVEVDAAPYIRLETLEYVERNTSTLQFNGEHTLFGKKARWGIFRSPVFDWTLASSDASLDQPDKRQFGSLWQPARTAGPIFIPATHRAFKPSANFTLGSLQRIYKEIEEESEQVVGNLKLPFKHWDRLEGYFKLGYFEDRVERKFNQDTFSNFSDNSSYAGRWDQYWSRNFAFENHPITESELDVDYVGQQDIQAYYAMVSLPVVSRFKIVGGVRFEKSRIAIVNDPEDEATWFPPGSVAPTQLNPGDGDATFEKERYLPSIAAEWNPTDWLTLRGSYNRTVARQTFKELSPILQQEFLGGPIFIGNPDLQMSTLQNYDLRLDLTPNPGGLISVSWFKKDLKSPIEYVQRVGAFDFTTAVNYPEGTIRGWEFEVRQDLGQFAETFEGLSVGANATLIDSEVTLSQEEIDGFNLPNIQAPLTTREMTNAPEHLYNLYVTYDVPRIGTQLAVFYTVQGDTLIAGAGQSNGNFVPSVFATEYETVNATLSQPFGEFLRLRIQAKNLTNSARNLVYRSQYIGEDVLRASNRRGIDYSISLGGEFRF